MSQNWGPQELTPVFFPSFQQHSASPTVFFPTFSYSAVKAGRRQLVAVGVLRCGAASGRGLAFDGGVQAAQLPTLAGKEHLDHRQVFPRVFLGR